METVYPSAASALARGRRARRPGPRARYRTVPVTFAEIKEVDEESEEVCAVVPSAERERERERRRPDVLDDQLARFAEFRRRRARRERDALRERAEEPAPVTSSLSIPPVSAAATAPAAPGGKPRAGVEPAAANLDT